MVAGGAAVVAVVAIEESAAVAAAVTADIISSRHPKESEEIRVKGSLFSLMLDVHNKYIY